MLKAMREKKGMSQRDLAASVGVTPAAVCLWEKGVAIPRAKTLIRLSQLFGCSIEEILKDVTT